MDYHTLPRRQLQMLCKKHGIPANSTNSDMADALTTLLKKPQPNSKEAEKRPTRSRDPASVHTVSNREDLTEESNTKAQKASGSHEKQEEESNKKPNRATRRQENTSVATQAPKSAASKAEKTLINGETESDSVSLQQGTKIREKSAERANSKALSTRNDASKQNNREKSAESENLREESPKSERKKDKTGGIVLRRGRVKVRSPGNHSKSPESMENLENDEVTANSEEKTIGKGGNSLRDTKRTSQTRKKQRSVTFSDVVEVNLTCLEDPSEEDALEVSGSVCEDPAEGKTGEIVEADRNSLKNLESACVEKKVVGTRKASRTASRKDGIQESTEASQRKEPVADIETNRESGSTRAVRGRKISTLEGAGTVEVSKEEKVVDSCVEGNLIEDDPSVLNTRRSRRSTIVPTDVNCNQDKDMAADKLHVKSQAHLEGSSIAPTTIGDAPRAKTSQRGRRRTLAPLELNQVQSDVEGPSQKTEKVTQVSKGKDSRIKSEVKNGATELPELNQKHFETTISESTPVGTQAEGKPGTPIKPDGVLHTAGNIRSGRRKTLMASNKMDQQAEGVERSVSKPESLKAGSKRQSNRSILVCSEPDALQEAVKEGEVKAAKSTSVVPRSTKLPTHPDEEVEVKTTKSTSVVPRSTRKATKLSTPPGDVTAVSQTPAFETQSNGSKQEGPAYRDDAMDEILKESEDLDVTAQATIELSLESPVLKVSQDPVNVPSNDTIIGSLGCQSLRQQTPIGHAVEQNQASCEDASSLACPDEIGRSSVTTTHSASCDPKTDDLCTKDVGSSSITATHSPTCDPEVADSSSLVDTEPIKPIASAVKSGEITEETLNHTPSECEQQGHGISIEEDASSNTPSECEPQGHEISIEEDAASDMKAMLVVEQDELINKIKDIKENLGSSVPISVTSLDDGNVDGDHYMNGNDLEESLVCHIDEVITAGSSAVDMESTFEHPIAVDKRVPEQELHSSEMHLLDSARDEIVNLASCGAADLMLTEKQEISDAVDFNFCDEQMAADKEEVKCHGDLNADQIQDTIEGVPCDEENSVDARSTSEEQPGQLPPLLPSSSANPGTEKQEVSGAVDFNFCNEQMAADKEEVKCHGDLNEDQIQDTIEGVGVPWDEENSVDARSTSEEQPGQLSARPRESACKIKHRRPRSIYDSARKAKSAVPWDNRSCDEKEDSDHEGQHTNDMSHDEVDSSSSDEEDSSGETEESLSDTEVSSTYTEVLIFNTEGDDSSSEDNTESDSEEATEFDSEEDFTEIDFELISGEEYYENEELDTSEEELSESEEDDSEDDTDATFDNSKASQVAQTVEDRPVEHSIAEFRSSLPIDEVTQGEAPNGPDIENLTDGYFLNVGITHTDVKTGDKSNDSKTITGSFASVTCETTEIQPNIGDLLLHDYTTSVDNVQSTTDSICLDDSWSSSLSSLFAAPLSKLEDVNCLLAMPSGQISERNASQQSKTLTTGSAMVDCTPVPAKLDSVEESSSRSALVNESASTCLEFSLKGTEVATSGSATLVKGTLDGNEATEGQVVWEENSKECDISSTSDNDCCADDVIQECKDENVVVLNSAYMAIDTTDSVVQSDLAEQGELCMDTADAKIHEESPEITCNLIERPGNLAEPECEQLQSEVMGNEEEFIQAENNVESLVSEVMTSKHTDTNKCSTPKCSKVSESSNVLDHESLMDVITAMQCVEIECQSAQVEEVIETALHEIPSSEESKEMQDKEIPAAHHIAHEVSKEQSMQQINLTLMSLRKLRQMCKGNEVSAPKKSETETPARKPFNTWMSAKKQVHQPSTSTHPRELPSASKRSALKALSSNIKSTPTAVQTPTAKVMQRPRNLMGTYDSNEGTGKHLVTPSSQAPKSSRKDLTRSLHR